MVKLSPIIAETGPLGLPHEVVEDFRRTGPREAWVCGTNRAVWLCYGPFQERLLCVVIRAGAGLLITAYPTDAVKQGTVPWTP